MVMGGASSSMFGSPERISSAMATSRSASSRRSRPSRTKCSWIRRTSGIPAASKQPSSGPLAGSGTSSRTRPLVVSCLREKREEKKTAPARRRRRS